MPEYDLPRRRLLRSLLWSVRLILLLGSVGLAKYHHLTNARGAETDTFNFGHKVRCFGPFLNQTTQDDGPLDPANAFSPILQSISEKTKCQECVATRAAIEQKRQQLALAQNSPLRPGEYFHAMILLTDTAPELIPLATGLLRTNRFKLTILRFHYDLSMPANRDDFRESEEWRVAITSQFRNQKFNTLHHLIRSGLPCDHPVRIRDDALAVVDARLPTPKATYHPPLKVPQRKCLGPTGVEPLDRCSMEAAPATIQVLKNYVKVMENMKAKQLQEPLSELIHPMPDVMIMDANLVGGLMTSEKWGIPTVAVASHNYLPLVVEHDESWTVGSTAADVEHSGWWLLGPLWRLLRQRWYSFSLTTTFMQLNMVRRDSLQLPYIRSPLDHLAPVVAVLMEYAPPYSLPSIPKEGDEENEIPNPSVDTTDATKQALGNSNSVQPTEWNRVHILGPITTECTLCSPASGSQEGESKFPKNSRATKTKPHLIAVMDYTDATLGVGPTNPIWTRDIMKALIMARNSLREFDDCDWFPLTCQKPFLDFEVVWFRNHAASDHYIWPHETPSYIRRAEVVSLLEGVAAYPEIVTAILFCDSNAAVVENLGIPVICAAETPRMPLQLHQKPPAPTDPRALASRILQSLRQRQHDHHKEQQQRQQNRANPARTSNSTTSKAKHAKKTSEPTSSFRSTSDSQDPQEDGLSRAVQIIERAAEAQMQQKGNSWKDVHEMQRNVLRAIKGETIDPISETSGDVVASTKDIKDSEPLHDSFTVLVAWIVVVSSLFYLIFLDRFTPRSTSTKRRNYSQSHGSKNSSADASKSFARPDLEDAYDLYVKTYRQQPDWISHLFPSITKDQANRVRNGCANEQNASTGHSSPRRRGKHNQHGTATTSPLDLNGPSQLRRRKKR